MGGLPRSAFGSNQIDIHVVLTLAVTVITALLVVGIGLGASLALAADAGGSEQMATATPQNVSEEAYVESVPEPGDEYYEAVDPDGNWISYINPRDEYREPHLGDGSGKICVTLLNEAGEPIVGETVPNTTVTVPTGEELDWHPDADPMVVEYPLTENYDRPLDADQFGTSADLPQGDGTLDSHCIEMHGQPEHATISYDEAEVDGDYADDIELVGYVQQANVPGWDSSVDPIENATSYEEAGGEWTFEPDASHGQVVIVLQLDRDPDDQQSVQSDDGQANESADGDTETADASDDSDATPGFAGTVAVVALLTVTVLATRRYSVRRQGNG